MDFKANFVLRPQPPIKVPPGPPSRVPLGPLVSLPGTWIGTGFNAIWRPVNVNVFPPVSGIPPDHFLELNLTNDQIAFTQIPGTIPNRGSVQPDISMVGMTYLQQISDANTAAGLHVEPGIWATVPPTSNPREAQTVMRMASIPHGTTLLAQGTGTTAQGAPAIPAIDIHPFTPGLPSNTQIFPEETLSTPADQRSPPSQLAGITQSMVDDPNSVLRTAIQNTAILTTTTVTVSSNSTLPLTGGGVENSTFLQGAPQQGPNGTSNGQSVLVTATFWIETLADGDPLRGIPHTQQLQYTQTVVLNFNNLMWPHVTVGTLVKQRA